MQDDINYPVRCKMRLRGDNTVTYFEVPRSVLVRAQEVRTKSEEEIESFFNEFIHDSEIGYLIGGVVYDFWNVEGDFDPSKRKDFVKKLDKKGSVRIEGEEQTWWIGLKAID